jgi:phage terminase large subunit-like protein
LTSLKPIVTPLTATGHPIRQHQLEETYRIVDDILVNLDAPAIIELTGGYESDVEKVIDSLVQETAHVITSENRQLDTGALGYLDAFTSEVEETLRCRSLNYFILQVLPEFILGWHNIEWGNLIQMYRLLGVLAARDHGKSYEFSFAYPLWQMYRYKPRGTRENPTPKELQMAREGMLVTNEFGLAKHLLSIMKSEVENNDILRERLFPGKRAEGWGAEKLTAKNGASIVVKSAGSKIRGYHPTWIVLDDFLNESSLYSQEQRDKYWNTFSAVLLPALSPNGQFLLVGTPFHDEDLYGTLKKQYSEALRKKDVEKVSELFKFFEYPAILPDGSLLFPERHSYDSILQKRDILGSLIFSREILVKPITDDSTIFPMDILRRAIKGQDDVDLIPNIDSSQKKFDKIVVGCDFAISSGVGADYSVFTVLGVDDYGVYHFLNAIRMKGARFNTQINALKKINMDFRPDIMYAEDNGMQEIFIQEMQDANLPVVGKNTNAINKKSLYLGVPSLAVLFESGRIKFPYKSQAAKNMTDLYFGELNSIAFIEDTGKLESTTRHDDTSMSLWNAVRAAKGNIDGFDFSFINQD